MNRAAIYARYSSDNQREESIDAQIRAIKEYAEREGISIIKIYMDEAKSATSDDRPQFLQMIKDSDLSLFDMVIVHKLDRFARNRYDSAFYKRKLKENGVRIISVLEQLDDSPESVILESVLEGMAEYYSKNLAREVMKGMRETALQCKHTGGLAPLGYDVAPDKTYVINEFEASAVKLIFDMYSKGKGYTEIIHALNSQGYKTKTGREFGKNGLHEILKNEKYTGVYTFNKTQKKVNGKRNGHKIKSDDEIIKIESGMPMIISKDVWNKVQERMFSNKHTKASNSAKEVYLLSGLIYCGKCGGAMTGNRRYAGRNKTLYTTYECSNRKRKQTCDAKAISKEYIETKVIDDLINTLFSKDGINKTVENIYNHSVSMKTGIDKDIKTFESELAGVQTELNNLVNAIAKGIFYPAMKDKMEELENKKTSLTISLEEAKNQQRINAPSKDLIKAYIMKDADIKNKSLEEQKRILQTYVKKVCVFENEIETYFIVNFDGGGDPYMAIVTTSIRGYRHSM